LRARGIFSALRIRRIVDALTRWPSHPVRIGPLAGNQAAVPAQDGAGRDQPVRPQLCRQESDQRGEDCAVGPVEPGRGLVRRSTAASMRR